MDGHSSPQSEQCPACSGIQARLTNVEKDTVDQWAAINESQRKFEEALREIGNRLPNWAAVVIAVGGTIAGALIGVLSTLVAVTGK